MIVDSAAFIALLLDYKWVAIVVYGSKIPLQAIALILFLRGGRDRACLGPRSPEIIPASSKPA